MANQPYMFTLDDESIGVIREVPKQKRSAYVRDAILLKARTLTGDEIEVKHSKRVKITV